jgi:hypothetical protein
MRCITVQVLDKKVFGYFGVSFVNAGEDSCAWIHVGFHIPSEYYSNVLLFFKHLLSTFIALLPTAENNFGILDQSISHQHFDQK